MNNKKPDPRIWFFYLCNMTNPLPRFITPPNLNRQAEIAIADFKRTDSNGALQVLSTALTQVLAKVVAKVLAKYRV
ncbi:hypothetical protein ACE02D_15105 [Shewanella bicestrii]